MTHRLLWSVCPVDRRQQRRAAAGLPQLGRVQQLPAPLSIDIVPPECWDRQKFIVLL